MRHFPRNESGRCYIFLRKTLEAMTIDEICEKAKALPASPALVPALLELLRREDSSLNDLEEIVARDTSLSAAVLRMANSAFYGGRGTFGDLPQALLSLGFSRTHELVLTVSGGRWNSINLEGYSWEPGDFYRHSLTVAVASRLVAEKVGYENQELAYAAGLIHEAGKLALAYAWPKVIDAVRQRQKEKGGYWLDAERAVLGFTHTGISAELLERWHFPESLLEVVNYYPYPEEAGEENRRLVQIVHLAKHLTIQMGVGNGEDAFWLPASENVYEELELAVPDLEELLAASLEGARKLLRENLLSGRIKI